MIEAWGELDVRQTFAEAAGTFTELVGVSQRAAGRTRDWGSGICVHSSGTLRAR